jgi:MSHA biogenesis protein MshP
MTRGHVVTLKRRQRGMSLVAALFMIVVLAMLSLFAVRIGASGEQGVTGSLLESRAMAAAQSGIEYGAYRALVAGNCNAPWGVERFNVNVALAGALAGFTVNVKCTGHDHMGYSTHEVTSTAQRGTYGSADYVKRSLTRTLSNGPP